METPLKASSRKSIRRCAGLGTSRNLCVLARPRTRILLSLVLNHDQRYIVGLRSALGEIGDGALHRIVQLAARICAVFRDHLAQPMPAEELGLQILRLRHSIRIDYDLVA